MIIKTQHDVTTAVLAELERAQDPRFKEIVAAAVQHLHGFVRDAKLTEAEFHQICALVARIGQLTTESHNEVVLTAGSLGISALVCLLNNGDNGQTETTANLMGPFWREGSPAMASGSSIVRSPTVGEPIFVNAWVRDREGRAVADAQVDVWHSSADGFYENQDPAQADMNLRGRFTTDAQVRAGIILEYHVYAVEPRASIAFESLESERGGRRARRGGAPRRCDSRPRRRSCPRSCEHPPRGFEE